jgi:cytochrome c556
MRSRHAKPALTLAIVTCVWALPLGAQQVTGLVKSSTMSTNLTLGAFLLSFFLVNVAVAQDRKAEQAIKHRRAAFVLMSTYFSRLLQTVEGGRPFDPGQVLKDARLVEEISHLPWEGFAPGSERGETRAKEEIWLDEDRFKAMATKLQTKTAELSKAAAAGSLPALKVAFEQTRDACDACHKEFRRK